MVIMRKTIIFVCLFAAFFSTALGNEKTEFLPTIEEPILVKEWLVVGPFSKGMREGDIDFLIEQGGEEYIEPYEGLEHTSIMAPSGTVKWMKAKTDEEGNVKFAFELKGLAHSVLMESNGQVISTGTGMSRFLWCSKTGKIAFCLNLPEGSNVLSK
jgi:hypothetical protein